MRYLVVAFGSLILFFPTYWLFYAVVGPDWGAGIAAIAMFIAYPILGFKLWPSKDQPPQDSMEVALSNDKLETAEYDVVAAAEIEEQEDEGMHYLLEISDGSVLSLSGQYLYGPVLGRRFPNTRIRVFWHQGREGTYGVQCLGSRLEVTAKLPPPTDYMLGKGLIPDDRQALPGPLNAVVQRLSHDA